MTAETGDPDSDETWRNSILSILKGETSKAGDDSFLKVKKLRKLVLLSMQLDDPDKASKKRYKKCVQALEKEGAVKLDADGKISLVPSGSSSGKKRKSLEGDEEGSAEDRKKRSAKGPSHEGSHDAQEDTNDPSAPSPTTSKPCKGNPKGVTRLFVGNLPFAVEEDSLEEFLGGKGCLTHIKWITDKETGRFYGSAFVEMSNSKYAADAVELASNTSKNQLMGRPIKINYCPARPGDVWPPEKRVISGGGNSSTTTTGGQAGGKGIKAMSPKPPNCVKLFVGNLSFEIEDDDIRKFFETVDAELKAIRWLHHRDSGDFKGCGFVEFWNSEACEKAATLNGKTLLGRPIRIDWTD